MIRKSKKVHHSGEDYNLAMSMRQGLFQRYFTWPFYLPMAIIGIPTEFFITHQGLNLLYQFWIHTELVDGLGDTLNYFMNVPKVYFIVIPQCYTLLTFKESSNETVFSIIKSTMDETHIVLIKTMEVL